MTAIFAAPIEQYPPRQAFSSVPGVSPAAAAGFPESRLIGYDPTLVFKSSGSGTTITWAFGSTREFDVVALIGTNATSAATWTITGHKSSGPLWAHAEGITNPDPNDDAIERNISFWYTPTPVSASSIEIVVADASNPGFTIGRLFVGKSFRPSKGVQYGTAFNFNDSGRAERTDRGALVLEEGRSIVSASVKMEFLNKEEMYDYAWEFNNFRKSTGEILACLDVDDRLRLQKNTLYCRIAEGRTVNFDFFNLHSQNWILESI